ncbi:MAG: PAS domain S-box protein [Nitrospira sp.]|nr:PAS domain S-box protein [Nitrospira sp.]
MSIVLLLSIGIRLGAVTWSIAAWRRIKDWRLGLLTLMLSLMAIRQILTLIHKTQSWDTVQFSSPTEIPGLGVSILAFLAVYFLKQLLHENACHLANLHESRATFKDLFDHSPDLYATVDAKTGSVLHCNHTFLQKLEHEEGEVLGHPILSFYAPASLERAKQVTNELLKSGQVQDAELQLQRSDGVALDVSLNASSIQDLDGQIMQSRCVWRDNTHRKELEEAQNRLQAAINQSSEGVGVYDLNRIIRFINPAHAQMFGYEPEELLGHLWTDLIEPDQVSQLISHLDPLPENTGLWYGELIGRKKTGERFYVEASLATLKNVNGHPAGVICSCKDITERKHQEIEREELIDQLETKNAELERFTYTVSHDLKSPLVTIEGFLSFVEQDVKTLNVEQLEADLQRIRDAVTHMKRLLGELLELSRIGRAANPIERCVMDEVAHKALDHLKEDIQRLGIHVDISPGLPWVTGDYLRLVEVLQNLLENAIKFMGEQPDPRIEISMRQDGNDTVLFVRDNGIGIDPAYQEKIFGLFERLESQIDGTGIGLALVKRIVDVHGGRIWVESEGKGHGSTFCLTLPDDRTEQSPSLSPHQSTLTVRTS